MGQFLSILKQFHYECVYFGVHVLESHIWLPISHFKYTKSIILIDNFVSILHRSGIWGEFILLCVFVSSVGNQFVLVVQFSRSYFYFHFQFFFMVLENSLVAVDHRRWKPIRFFAIYLPFLICCLLLSTFLNAVMFLKATLIELLISRNYSNRFTLTELFSVMENN